MNFQDLLDAAELLEKFAKKQESKNKKRSKKDKEPVGRANLFKTKDKKKGKKPGKK